MEKKQLHIDYLTFEESGQIVSYAPQLDLCFNNETKEESIQSLKDGSAGLLDFWKEKSILKDKIVNLGLNGTTTPSERAIIERNISIPYFIIKKTHEKGSFNLDVEV